MERPFLLLSIGQQTYLQATVTDGGIELLCHRQRHAPQGKMTLSLYHSDYPKCLHVFLSLTQVGFDCSTACQSSVSQILLNLRLLNLRQHSMVHDSIYRVLDIKLCPETWYGDC